MIGALVQRLRSPSSRAVRDAGPPDRQVIAALALATVVAVVVSATGATTAPLWLVFAVVAGIGTGVVAVADRDGWRMRTAMGYVALAQRRRWRVGSIPKDVQAANTWLADPASSEANDLERAAILFNAGRWEEADALLQAFSPSSGVERASWIRLRSTVDGRSSGHIEMDGLRAAVTSLEPAEARYQLTAAAWSQAWLDIAARRPWRQRFAEAVTGLGPFEVPARYRVWMAIQQLVAPIACVAAALIFGVIVGT